MLTFKDHFAEAFISADEWKRMEPQLQTARDQLDEGTCPGADYTGWIDLPLTMDQGKREAIQGAADRIRENFDVLILVGIGGSYLGARAVIEALTHQFAALLPEGEREAPLILFAGHQISADYMRDLVQVTRGKRVALNVISKSGTTTEPALAFRILRQHLLGSVPDGQLADYVTVTTDPGKGALRELARRLDLPAFDIPDHVGGRFSVLTAVGLLPIAVAGIDIGQLLAGAGDERVRSLAPLSGGWSPADRYAVARTLLNRKGFPLEILVSYEPFMRSFSEWWKQLFGESEGKDGRGIIPYSADFTTDLHSLGQMIQEGPRVFFETLVRYEKTRQDLVIPDQETNWDQLGYLAGKTMTYVNERASQATLLAHAAGGVPILELLLQERTAKAIGHLIYFFERACALSALMNGVNPFDQPGVEAYKRNMFALLGKPGFESLRAGLEG